MDEEDWQGMVKTITDTFRDVADQEHQRSECNFKILKNKIRVMGNQLQCQEVANKELKCKIEDIFILLNIENFNSMMRIMEELKTN